MLTVRQKNLLDDIFRRRKINDVEDMSEDEWGKLVAMRNCETLLQDANRHLMDLWLEWYYS